MRSTYFSWRRCKKICQWKADTTKKRMSVYQDEHEYTGCPVPGILMSGYSQVARSSHGRAATGCTVLGYHSIHQVNVIEKWYSWKERGERLVMRVQKRNKTVQIYCTGLPVRQPNGPTQVKLFLIHAGITTSGFGQDNVPSKVHSHV